MFRKHNGHSLDELPFRAAWGVTGSYICVFLAVIALVAQFYVALYPIGGPYLDAEIFFQLYLAGPFLIGLYFMWKIYSWFKRPADRPFFVPLGKIDIYSGMREEQARISAPGTSAEERRASVIQTYGEKPKRTPKERAIALARSLF